MATTLKAILDVMALALQGTGVGSGDARAYGWIRSPDSRETKLEPGHYRLLASDFDRAPEFGIDATETLEGQILAEFCRAAQAEDDASFFAELSLLAKAVEAATYPSGTVAAIVRTRRVERQFADPTWIVGTLGVSLKWEQAY